MERNSKSHRSHVAEFVQGTYGRMLAKWLTSACTVAALLFSPSAFAQLPYTEDFSTTVYQDTGAGQTTADWNVGAQQLQLPVAPVLNGTTFDDSTAVEVIVQRGRWHTQSVALVDLDGDGDLDLIDGVRGTTSVRLNDGGTFGNIAYKAPSSTNTRSIAAGDVDRDGDIDFIEGNYKRSFLLYLNDGTGTDFDVQRIATANRAINGVALADIDGDGLLDVIAVSVEFQTNRVYLNTGDPLFPFGPQSSPGDNLRVDDSSRDVVVGDIDNDGDVDLVLMNEDTPFPGDPARTGHNRVYMNMLDRGQPNTFRPYRIDIDGPDDVDQSVRGALGDINGDGYLDLVVANNGAGQASKIYFNNASGSANDNPFTISAVPFAGGTSPDGPALASSVALGDADNDGDLDIFLTSESIDFRNRVYFNDGSGVITGFVDVGPVGQFPLVLQGAGDTAPASMAGAVGDIDNDGDLDWVIGNRGTSSPTAPLENMVFRNSGTGGATLALQLQGRATSLQIGSSGTGSVKLNPAPVNSMVGSEFLNHIDFLVSGNGGQSWSVIFPDGRPVSIATGSDIRWRAELRSESPAAAVGLALLQLDVADNQTGPVLGMPIGNAEVIEDDGTTGLPISSDFSDPDGDTIYHSVMGLAAGTGLAIDPLSGQIVGTPNNDDSLASPVTVTVYATDGALTATDTFTLTVVNTNDPPSIISTPPAGDATEDVVYMYTVVASDPDPDETPLLSFSTTTAPAWLSLTDNGDGSALLAGTPTDADVGADNTVTVVVTDPSGSSDSQTFTINVINVDEPPEFTSMPPAAGATQGIAYTYDVMAEDPDTGQTAMLIFSAPVLPSWLSLVDNGDGSAMLSGTPAAADVTGDNAVTLVVNDPDGLSASQSFVVDVAAPPNRAPSFITEPVVAATETMGYLYPIRAIDPDLDEVIVSAHSIPSWLEFNYRGNGFASLRGVPTGSDVGEHEIVIVAQEMSPAPGMTVQQTFTISVTAAADGPIITLVGDPESRIFEGTTYNDPGATARDAQDGDLTDRIVASGSVNTARPGIYTIQYSVSDSGGNASEARRTVEVVDRPADNGGIGSTDRTFLLILAAMTIALRLRRRRRDQ